MKKTLFTTSSTPSLHFQNIIPEMATIESMLYDIIARGENMVSKMCAHLLQSGGKRLRPLLVILSGKSLSPLDNNRLIVTGVAVELIHMASLVHDDVIDKSLSRRGSPTLNSLWDNQMAVLAGDYLFSKAFDLMTSHGLYQVLQLMTTAIQDMCAGEIEQASHFYDTKQKEEDYFDRIEKKTAKLIAACCQAGAIISQKDDDMATAMKIYGTNLGYTFQIADDLLDFTGNPAKLGKPICQDLTQGNLTLPVLYLLKHPQFGPWLKEIIINKKLDSANIKTISSILEETDILNQTYHVAKHCADVAKGELSKLPPSRYKDMLEMLTDMALDRSS